MHIVFDARIHMDFMSGISRYIMMLLEHLFRLDKQNKYSIILNNTLSKDNPIFEFDKLNNVTCITTPFAHMGPKSYFQLPKFIKSLNADVYHYPHIDTPYFGIPTVSTVHDSNISNGVKRYSDFLGIKTLYFRQSLKRNLKKSDRVIFISNSMKKEILESYNLADADKYPVIYNGFDEGFKNLSISAIPKIRQQFAIDKPFFFYAGALREHKNVKRIIAAFNAAQLEDYELIMVGSKYDKYPVDLNFPNIRHLGMVSDEELKALYSLSYAFLFPSLFEGFGLPILEAMSFGSPVITTNYGATKEVGGDNVALVNPEQTDEITAAILQLVNNNEYYNNLQLKGFDRVKEFSWETTAKAVLKLYESVVRK